MLSVSNMLGRVVENSYDSRGLAVSSMDALGLVATNRYDGAGNLTNAATGFHSGATFAPVTSTGFGYDLNGNRTTQTIWRRVNGTDEYIASAYGHDAQNRLVAVTNALGTADQVVTRTIYKEDMG